MRILADTNIALRYIQKDSELHAETEQAVARLLLDGHQIVLVPQILYELWAVGTRPAKANGAGWTTAVAKNVVNVLLEQFELVEDVPGVFPHWLSLVGQHGVPGKPTHDARLAAAIQIHGLDAILTRNTDDFKRFGLNVIHPDDLSSGDSTP